MGICRYWSKDGRCPIRGCPHGASHTAANSPRYSKFMDSDSVPLNEVTNVDTNVAPRRANALQIKEPSLPEEQKGVEAEPQQHDNVAKKSETPSPGSRLGRWMGAECWLWYVLLCWFGHCCKRCFV